MIEGGLAEDDRVGGLVLAVDDVGRGRGEPLEEVPVEHVIDVDPLLPIRTTNHHLLALDGGRSRRPFGLRSL
ncbi:hypothetical protein NL676_008600 [Syzygium grande]|nr:hypothetical protein NL676_008600 [Syzygium grande]